MAAKEFKTLTVRHLIANKLAVVGVSAVTGAVLGTTGVAAAAQMTSSTSANMDTNSSVPSIVKECKNALFRQSNHFNNVGQCLNALKNKHHHNGHGHGYGGDGNGNNVSASVNINVSGNHNIIRVVLNFLFGH